MELPLKAKAVVVSAPARAGFCWAVAAAAVAAPIYAGLSPPRMATAAAVFVVVWPLVTLLAFVFPVGRYGQWVAGRITGRDAPARLANVAAGLAIAIGEPEGRVAVIDAAAPNVGAFPTRSGNLVVATAAAVESLDRDELEGLVASQLVVAGDRWVRWATAAQLLQSPRFALLFGSVFVNPVLMPMAFLAFFGGRYADGARDLVADAAAVGATRNPEPLVRALRHLAAFSASANELRPGLPGFLVDQFWVLSEDDDDHGVGGDEDARLGHGGRGGGRDARAGRPYRTGRGGRLDRILRTQGVATVAADAEQLAPLGAASTVRRPAAAGAASGTEA